MKCELCINVLNTKDLTGVVPYFSYHLHFHFFM